jgi:hypothetical protein
MKSQLTFVEGFRIHSLNFWLNKVSRCAAMRLAKLAKQQRAAAFAICNTQLEKPSLPVTVKMVRIAPRKLDEGDNLSGGFKHVRDGIADWLGVDDGGKDVTWVYEQRKGKPRQYAIEISLQEDHA